MADTIAIDEAFKRILEYTPLAALERVPLGHALGRALAEDIRADRDWPPFNRSAVDGYALRSSDTSTGAGELDVIEEIPAGKTATKLLTAGTAIRIMTGAPVPEGADAVIMQERTETVRAGRIKFLMKMSPGQNLSKRGEDATAGSVVILAGTAITPAEIGVLAAVGCVKVPVRTAPRIAVFGTGDEIVEPHETPGPAQIRNSNSQQLLAQCAALGWNAEYLGVARDNAVQTRELVERALTYDVVISTGGVSVGEHDHVGHVLRDLGVKIIFDKVAIKPGKPTTFGVRDKTLVFGLPGNPVAAFVCFRLFVTTALRMRAGVRAPLPKLTLLPLRTDVKSGGDRTTFRPARLVSSESGTQVEALEWHGSGHLAALVGAEGLCVQPPNVPLKAGRAVAYHAF
ncbi:MAG TPA: gephyrin-like molybdotransferase Glp [Planctomycetota bacterium]|nr:gephyrin-like molybdotransferase Glp [Planctomycetota bacterium]